MPRLLLLAFVAGYVDTATFVEFAGLFAAHVTGNFVLFAAAIGRGVAIVVMGLAGALGLAAPDAAAADLPAFKLLRFDEDYRFLGDRAPPAEPLDRIKYIPLDAGPATYLSFGGELREKIESFSPRNFGFGGAPNETYLLHRFLVHGDLHVDDVARAFIQFGDHLEAGKRARLGPTDQSRLDLQQGFADLHGTPAPGIDSTLRLGRQEISYGSQRLVSVRESPNIRRSFDAARSINVADGVRVDAFYARPVTLEQDVFKASASDQQTFWGLYATTAIPALAGTGIDLYYLGLDNEAARFGTTAGAEHRHSIGMRLFGHADAWDWDWEGVYQFGRFAGRDIDAWTAASTTGYTIVSLPWMPRLGLKADIASGDRDPKDRTLGTFNPLFPKLAYFSEASLISPGNIANLYPTVTILPLSDISVTVGWDFFWRAETRDAVYGNPFTPLPGTTNNRARWIGQEMTLDVAWQVSRHVTLAASYDHFAVGDALKRAGGRDVDFTMALVAFRF